MKYPELVPDHVCSTPITITVTNGIGEDGAPAVCGTYTGKCCYSEASAKRTTADKQLITLSGVALFNGDIIPGLDVFDGGAVILGGNIRRSIYRSQKARNPDGTVNYTRLELI